MDPERTGFDFRVEVSGWDVAESFFVEKVILEFTEAGERVVHLKHPVCPGLIVFLRLIDSRVIFPALPVAYQVMQVVPNNRDEPNRVSLRKLRHRRKDGKEELASGRVELL